MFRTFMALAVLALASPALGSPFDENFHDQTLRMDYFHGGGASGESIILDRLLTEGEWPGSRVHLTDQPDYGKYRLVVAAKATGKSIYEQGFSSLFGEWQTTDEAKQLSRVFHETVRFPMPRVPFTLTLLSRDHTGALVPIYKQPFDLNPETVEKGFRHKDIEVIPLHTGGDSATSLDVVIIADGYTAKQLKKGRADLERFAKVFLETPPFNRYKKHINLWGILPTAPNTGPDAPRKGIFVGSPVRTSFDTFGSPRYLTTTRNRTLRDIAAHAPYDAITVIVNTSRYGGAGIYNQFAISISDNEYDEYVFMHEFGHSFAGLGDEYYSSSVAYSDFYPKGVEPWEPNITALLDGPKGLKWSDQVTPNTPIPTPEVSPKYDHAVGAFEGAGYCAKGLYRGAMDCKMFSKRHIDYCPICSKAVEAVLSTFVE